MDVSIVVTNHNSVHLIKECIGSIQQQTYRNFEIIFVDDASTDNSLQVVSTYFPDVKKIACKNICKPAKARNIGIEHSQGKYVAFVDIDVIVDKNWLSEMMFVLSNHGDIAACTPKVYKYPYINVIDNTGHGLFFDFGTIHRDEWRSDDNFNRSQEVFGVCLAAPLIRKQVIKQIGVLDESYEFTSGDEWSFRMRSRGWKILFVPTAKAYHKRQSTQDKNKWFLYYSERNRIYSIIQYMPLNMIVKSPYYTIKRFIFLRRLKIDKNVERLRIIVAVPMIIFAWIKALVTSYKFFKKRKVAERFRQISLEY